MSLGAAVIEAQRGGLYFRRNPSHYLCSRKRKIKTTEVWLYKASVKGQPWQSVKQS